MAPLGAIPAPLWPAPLKPGDKVRFLSPASPPERAGVMRRAAIIRQWGLTVDFGAAAFHRHGYLAGTDEERLADFNVALNDRSVRAIVTTRGGKGSYRIADGLDFAALRADPKFIVGFSDIAILQAMCIRACGLVGIHGALMGDDQDRIAEVTVASLWRTLMGRDDTVIQVRPDEATASLTTTGVARGRLVGGHLETIAAGAGWALPPLHGAIWLVEAVDMQIGQTDRILTMLRKSGHLAGLAGVAVGQFTGFDLERSPTVLDLLREHLGQLHVPILGGLPLGHGPAPLSVPVGAVALLDADAGRLTVPASAG